jgi:hypothetical protein
MNRHNFENNDATVTYFNPSTMIAQQSFTIQLYEECLLIFDINDIVYRYRGCCNFVDSPSTDQLCILIRNCSPTKRIKVLKGTVLKDLLQLPCLSHRLCYVDIASLMYEKENETEEEEDNNDDDSAIVLSTTVVPSITKDPIFSVRI